MEPETTIRTRIQIRRVSDGTVKEGNGPDAYGRTRIDAAEAANYWWTDGNGGCDCNRSLYFNRFGGEPDGDIRCSDELFQAKVTDADSGDVIVDEFE